MVTLGSGSTRKTEDVLLSRYAAYLVVMNGDPKMPVVAMGKITLQGAPGVMSTSSKKLTVSDSSSIL